MQGQRPVTFATPTLVDIDDSRVRCGMIADAVGLSRVMLGSSTARARAEHHSADAAFDHEQRADC